MPTPAKTAVAPCVDVTAVMSKLSETGQFLVAGMRKALKQKTALERLCADEKAKRQANRDAAAVVAALLAQRGYTGPAKEEIDDILQFMRDRDAAYTDHIVAVRYGGVKEPGHHEEDDRPY